jgi:sec-independent protein translocase protein TatC
MATVMRQVSHEDQLSLVEHLDELRTRLLVSIFAFMLAFGVCLWQNDRVLDIVNRPFHVATQHSAQKGALSATAKYQRAVIDFSKTTSAFAGEVSANDNATAAEKATAAKLIASASVLQKAAPSLQRQPVTLGVAEPFTASLKVAAAFAFLISLPIILWQLYAFVLPAFSPDERAIARPLMFMVPFLFIAGAVFAYYVVLPSAIRVLQNFNSDNFDILIQAKDLYRFTIFTCMGVGALFQVPIGILLLVRAHIVSVKQLRDNRRYAILIEAILAMLLPGTDPITMLLSMAPLFVLYEASIIVASFMERKERKHAAEHPDEEYGPAWWRDDEDDDEDD